MRRRPTRDHTHSAPLLGEKRHVVFKEDWESKPFICQATTVSQTWGTAEEHSGATHRGGRWRWGVSDLRQRCPPTFLLLSKWAVNICQQPTTCLYRSLLLLLTEPHIRDACLSIKVDAGCLYWSVWFPQKLLSLLVCHSSKEVKHGLSLLQHEIVGITEWGRRRMWSSDPPVRRLNKEKLEGQSVRPDKCGPGLCWPLFTLQTYHWPIVTSVQVFLRDVEGWKRGQTP